MSRDAPAGLRPVDLRSDTLTRPTPAMLAAMAAAEVGDDVFGEDPTVIALQAQVAARVGKPAGLFVPSGTMSNQIALRVHTRHGEEAVVGEGAHLLSFEGGAAAALAGVQLRVAGRGGLFDADALRAVCNPADPSGHQPRTALVALENTHNRGGGRVWPWETYASVCAVAREIGAAVHLDGARLFNAVTASGIAAERWCASVDTVSICLSKGLGAPVGSVLCGSVEAITVAHRYRKMYGGGMRQAGVLAAAGLYALEHHVSDLAADHARARRLALALAELPGVELDPATVQTNIVIFGRTAADAPGFCAALAPDLRVLPFGARFIRAVLHRDVDDAQLDRAIAALRRVAVA